MISTLTFDIPCKPGIGFSPVSPAIGATWFQPLIIRSSVPILWKVDGGEYKNLHKTVYQFERGINKIEFTTGNPVGHSKGIRITIAYGTFTPPTIPITVRQISFLENHYIGPNSDCDLFHNDSNFMNIMNGFENYEVRRVTIDMVVNLQQTQFPSESSTTQPFAYVQLDYGDEVGISAWQYTRFDVSGNVIWQLRNSIELNGHYERIKIINPSSTYTVIAKMEAHVLTL